MKRVVVFSHGFGVAKDSNGLFTDLAAGLGPDAVSILFDYNQFDEAARTMTAQPFSEQAALLNWQIEQASHTYPGLPISLIAHSQGCVTAAMAKPEALEQVILLTPAESFSLKRLEKTFTDRLRPEPQADGSVRLPRRDGSAIIITPGYMKELEGVEPPALYNDLAAHMPVVLIRAEQDDILGRHVDDSLLGPSITILKLPGDHNFTDPGDRHGLITTLKQLIVKNF